MTVEIEFSTDRPYDNTPEFREKMFGTNNPNNHVSSSTPTNKKVRTEILVNKIKIVIEGIGKSDLSNKTKGNFVNALETNLPNCKHTGVRER